MNFKELVLILKARSKLIMAIFILIVGVTTLFSLTAPKQYKASTSIVLNFQGVDPVTGKPLPAYLTPGYMATQLNIIASRRVAIEVVKSLKLTEAASIQQDFDKVLASNNGKGDITTWLADKLLKKLYLQPTKNSSVIDIVYEGSDPDFCALIANTFAESYRGINIKLKADPAKNASEFLVDQSKSLKVKLEEAQANLSKYQSKNQITSIDGSLDIELAKLNELSTQLTFAENQLYESKSRSKSGAGISPDVALNPIVQNLKIQLAMSESKLSQISKNFGNQHPNYITAQAEVSKQKRQLNNAIASASRTIKETKNIYQRRVSELTEALKKQKQRVLALNLARDEYSVLKSDVVNAENALLAASQQLSNTMQGASSNQSDISILNRAIAPTTYSSPRIMLNILMAVFLGLFLSFSSAIVLEMLDRRVRSKDDISKYHEVPVFVISNKQSRKPAVTSNLIQNNS